ncbi:MAG: transposase [Frankiales bacterium]|nr:transposase [Frankiales bacterium]
MARIEGVERGGLLVRIAYAVARRRFGQVPEPLTLWAHSPRLMLTQARFEAGVEKWKAVDPVTRSLTVLRAAQVIDCPWCLDFGSSLARADGVTQQQLDELGTWETSAAYTPGQRAAFAYAEAATRTPMEVTDAHVAALREHFSEAGVVELAMMVAIENQRSRFNHGLGVQAQGYCRVPAGSAG